MSNQEAGPAGTSVAELTRSAMGRLSTGERKVARALLSAYPVAGLETVAELASRSGVGRGQSHARRVVAAGRR